MELRDFLEHVSRGAVIESGSEQHLFMHGRAQEALRIVAELNNEYRTPDQVRALLCQLTGSTVEEGCESWTCCPWVCAGRSLV